MRYKGQFTVSIDELKKRIDAEKYTKISHFKDRVLEPAIEEIDNMTDLEVEYNYIKTGRQITHIVFSFDEKSSIGMAITRRLQDSVIEPENRKAHREMMKKIEAKRKQIKNQEQVDNE